MAARRRTEHGGGVTVLTRWRPKVGLHHRRRCHTSRQHGNRYQSGLRVAGEVGSGEHVLAAMADAHGGVVRSHVMVAVAVKQ